MHTRMNAQTHEHTHREREREREYKVTSRNVDLIQQQQQYTSNNKQHLTISQISNMTLRAIF